MAHPNEGLIRRGYAAFAAGDVATLKELFADNIVWHVGGRSPITGDYSGPGEVLGFFGRLAGLAGGTFRNDVHDVLANDEHVVALVTLSGSRDGKTLHDNGAQVFHVAGGKVTEVWFHPGDQAASDEFWS
jgi:ketosteroid isomerase-like protein